jgi:hypothetical protein
MELKDVVLMCGQVPISTSAIQVQDYVIMLNVFNSYKYYGLAT